MAGISKTNKPEHKFKFGGKEFDKTFGLNWGDFGARQHDPVLGRWFVIDPKADEFYVWSPYNYALNNPLRYVDPDGKKPLDWYLDLNGALVHKKDLRGNQESKGLLWVGSEKSGPNAQLMSMTRDRFSNDPEFRSRILSEMDKVRVRASGQANSSYPVFEVLSGFGIKQGAKKVGKFVKGLFKRGAKKQATKQAAKKFAKDALHQAKNGKAAEQLDKISNAISKARKAGGDAKILDGLDKLAKSLRPGFSRLKNKIRVANADNKVFQEAIDSGQFSTARIQQFQRWINTNNQAIQAAKSSMANNPTFQLLEQLRDETKISFPIYVSNLYNC